MQLRILLALHDPAVHRVERDPVEETSLAPRTRAATTTTSTQEFSSTINAATKATYSNPSRNSVTVMRTVNRGSLRNRLCICITPAVRRLVPLSSVHLRMPMKRFRTALRRCKGILWIRPRC